MCVRVLATCQLPRAGTRDDSGDRAGGQRRPAATQGAWRVLRGGVVGAVATGLALAAHVWAGGQPPGLSLLLTAGAGVAVASVTLSRYRWTSMQLLLLLVAAEWVLHELFDQANPSVIVHPAGHLSAGVTGDGSMTLAHVLAAGATACVLARGEDWLWLLLELLALRAVRQLRPVHRVLTVDTPAFTPVDSPPVPPVGVSAGSLRGPPSISQ